MTVTKIKLSWHKVNDKIAMTYKQLNYINELRDQDNCPEWPFVSSTNAMRSLTKFNASEIIDALKSGNKIIFNQ